MKKQKKKSLQIVKRIVTLFLILAITSTQIEPSVFAAGSDEQWASESLKEDAVTENKSADATVDSTGTTNTDEDHTEDKYPRCPPELQTYHPPKGRLPSVPEWFPGNPSVYPRSPYPPQHPYHNR